MTEDNRRYHMFRIRVISRKSVNVAFHLVNELHHTSEMMKLHMRFQIPLEFRCLCFLLGMLTMYIRRGGTFRGTIK